MWVLVWLSNKVLALDIVRMIETVHMRYCRNQTELYLYFLLLTEQKLSFRNIDRSRSLLVVVHDRSEYRSSVRIASSNSNGSVSWFQQYRKGWLRIPQTYTSQFNAHLSDLLHFLWVVRTYRILLLRLHTFRRQPCRTMLSTIWVLYLKTFFWHSKAVAKHSDPLSCIVHAIPLNWQWILRSVTEQTLRIESYCEIIRLFDGK